jgi:hypothetical protein
MVGMMVDLMVDKLVKATVEKTVLKMDNLAKTLVGSSDKMLVLSPPDY